MRVLTTPAGAFSIRLELAERGDEVSLLEAALAEGVGHGFRPPDARTSPVGLRLCYSNAPVESFDEGVRRLSRALAR